MNTMRRILVCAALTMTGAWSLQAGVISFSTGAPNGKMGSGSRPSGPSLLEIESADDFILSDSSAIDHATFTGLLTSGATLTTSAMFVARGHRVSLDRTAIIASNANHFRPR
jgi:hypothetical protein